MSKQKNIEMKNLKIFHLSQLKSKAIFISHPRMSFPYRKPGPAMQLTISRCFNCKKSRLVDRVENKWVCFACKQRDHVGVIKPVDQFVKADVVSRR